MFVELIGTLYCPQAHEPTLLLAAVDRIAGRHVELGTLACPVCDARYPIVDGVVVFDPARYAAAGSVGSGHRSASVYRTGDEVRAAAFLDLTEPGGFVLVTGEWSPVAEPLSEATGVAVIVLNPPDVPPPNGIPSPIYAGPLPFARGALRGALLDSESDSDAITAAVRPRGRLVGPASLAVPTGSRELARDADLWVAERLGETAPLIGLRRADHDQAPE